MPMLMAMTPDEHIGDEMQQLCSRLKESHRFLLAVALYGLGEMFCRVWCLEVASR
jgi:hypothetical protein